MNRLAAAVLMVLSTNAIGLDAQGKFGQAGHDISDLWWNPGESGWGINVIQQSGTSFATLFVYAANGSPTWFVVPAMTYSGYDAASGEHVHAGDLFQTSGPAYSASSFNPGLVGVRQVGRLTLRTRLSAASNAIYAGSVSYSVDGVTVSKAVERQTWKTANHAGTYLGSIIETWSSCTNASLNREYAYYGKFTITQSSANPPVLTIDFFSSDAKFSYGISGKYYQAGRNGVVPNAVVAASDTGGYLDLGKGFLVDLNSGVFGVSGSGSFYEYRASPGCIGTARFAATR